MFDEVISKVHAEKITTGQTKDFVHALKRTFATVFETSLTDLTGQVILIKPNLNNFSPIDLQIVEAIVVLLQSQKAKVYLGDSPLFLNAPVDSLYRTTGLTALSHRLGFELLQLECEGTEKVRVGSNQYYVSRFARNSNLIINLAGNGIGRFPVSHSLFGFLPGFQGSQQMLSEWGRYGMGETLIDILSIIKPDIHLSYVDYDENEKAHNSHFLVGSADLIALESILEKTYSSDATCFQTIGSEAGIGHFRPETIKLSGVANEIGALLDVQQCKKLNSRIGLSLLAHLSLPMINTRLVLNPENCEACGDCVSSCSSGALQQKTKGYPPLIRHNNCLNCWECLYRCDKGAIEISSSYRTKQLIDFWRRTCAI